MNRADLRSALSHPNVAAFARVVREGESSQSDHGYRMRWGGLGKPPAYFESFADHPRIFEPTTGGRKSSAAGAYQATATTWDEARKVYGWPDFTPASQDEFFVARVVYRKALEDVMAGRFDEACRKCRNEWTSLPGGDEANSATKRARETYIRWGGRFDADPDDWQRHENYGEAVTESTVQGVHMAPLILPLLQVAAQFLPQLAEKFGSGSEVANRNIAAGKVLAEAITTATNSPNLQAAVEKMAEDPESVREAKVAVAQAWPELFEVAGGIVEARKAAGSADQVPPSRNPAVWFMGALVPLIYGAAYLVLTGESFSQDAKMMVITAIFSGLLAAGTGFFLGSSLGSQRKTSMIGKE